MISLRKRFTYAAAAASLLCSSISHSEMLVLPVPVMPEVAEPVAASYVAPPVVKSVTLAEAKAFFNVDAKKNWQIESVSAPVCEKFMTKKKCQEVKRICKSAKDFAVKHKNHGTCSNLYTEARVVFTLKDPTK